MNHAFFGGTRGNSGGHDADLTDGPDSMAAFGSNHKRSRQQPASRVVSRHNVEIVPREAFEGVNKPAGVIRVTGDEVSLNTKVRFSGPYSCGERGIRTPKSLRTPVFKTGAIAVLPALLSKTDEIRGNPLRFGP
jgi:hypothetical protein